MVVPIGSPYPDKTDSSVNSTALPAFLTFASVVDVVSTVVPIATPSATSSASPMYAYFGTIIVLPGLPTRVVSILAIGENLIFFGSFAETISAITFGSTKFANFVCGISYYLQLFRELIIKFRIFISELYSLVVIHFVELLLRNRTISTTGIDRRS